MTLLLAILFLITSVGCYSIRELYYHGKLKWMKDDASFWGERSHYRKYANPLDEPKNNWYYKFFRIGYKEKHFGSATILVWTTDGAHLMQALFFLFISSSICIALELLNWHQFLLVYSGVRAVHFVTYRLLQR